VQILTTGGSKLANVLKVCTSSNAWTQVSFSLAPWAGQTVVISFNVHDDGHAGDPSWSFLDDVAVG
jgi:hypothetical protein